MSAPTRQIVVDDTDRGIKYSGPNWILDTGGDLDKLGTYGPIYNHTSHGTTANSNLSFSFSGSSISVFGTIVRAGTPTWKCSVDQVNLNNGPPFSTAQNNWILCEEKVLKAGPHTLSIQIAASANNTFWFDYLRYTPLSDTSFSGAVLYVPGGQVNLTSNWEPRGGIPSVDDVQLALHRNSMATFEFVGTHVAWYGWLLRNEPLKPTNSTIVIDDHGLELATVGNTPPFNVTHPNVMLFQTPQLAATQHKLEVTYLGDTTLQSTPLSLNYLLVTITSTPFAPSDPLPSTTSGLQFSSSSSASFPSQSSSSTPHPSSTTAPQAHSSSTGIIAGSVVGGLALVTIIVGYCFLRSYRRRRRQAQPFTMTQPLTFEGFTDTKGSRGHRDNFSSDASSSFAPIIPLRIVSFHKPPLYNVKDMGNRGQRGNFSSDSFTPAVPRRTDSVHKPPLHGVTEIGSRGQRGHFSSDSFAPVVPRRIESVHKPPLHGVTDIGSLGQRVSSDSSAPAVPRRIESVHKFPLHQ